MSAKELNIGDYVRTKGGIIAKCIKEECDRYVFDKIIVEDGYYKDYEYKDVTPKGSYILKSSPNIIDLIEVGDYVNGAKVVRVKTDENGTKWVYTNNENAYGYKSNEIKSIITYEQFKAMEYKL